MKIDKYLDNHGLISKKYSEEIGVEVVESYDAYKWLISSDERTSRFDDGSIKLYQFGYSPRTDPTDDFLKYYSNPIIASPSKGTGKKYNEVTSTSAYRSKKLLDAIKDYAICYDNIYNKCIRDGLTHKNAVETVEKDLQGIVARINYDDIHPEKKEVQDLIDYLTEAAFEMADAKQKIMWTKEHKNKVAEVTGCRKNTNGPIVSIYIPKLSAISIINLLGNNTGGRGSALSHMNDHDQIIAFFRGDNSSDVSISDATRTYRADGLFAGGDVVNLLHVTDWNKFIDFAAELHINQER